MRWDVDPVLVDFGAVSIRWYGLMFASGVFIAATVFGRLFARRGYPEKDGSTATLWMLIGLVLGAHLLHLAFYEPRSFIDNPIRILEVGYGLASHGGALGAMLALWLFCRRRKVPYLPYADCLALATVWVIPFIRVGNFFNSEIVGRPTTVPWGVVFLRRGFLNARHPAQLYEALVGVILILLAYHVDRNRTRYKPGFAMWMVLCVYFTARFLIEFVKAYQVLSSSSFPLTMGHMLSIPIIAVSAWGLKRTWGAPESLPT